MDKRIPNCQNILLSKPFTLRTSLCSKKTHFNKVTLAALKEYNDICNDHIEAKSYNNATELILEAKEEANVLKLSLANLGSHTKSLHINLLKADYWIGFINI